MLLELLAAVLVGAAVLWLVIVPLVRPEPPRPVIIEPEDPGETKRGIKLAALKELEFDRELGKISDEDYVALRATITAEALAVLREEEDQQPADTAVTLEDAEALIAARARARAGDAAPACVKCGPCTEPDAAFCSRCGGTLGGAQCRTCARALVPGGRFCEDCGTPVAA